MQNHLNLLYREEEREMLGLCQSEGIAVIPWSPLARGRLTRAWQSETTKRAETDVFGKQHVLQQPKKPTARLSKLSALSPRNAGSPARSLPSRGSSANPASPPPSSAPASRIILKTPSPRSQ